MLPGQIRESLWWCPEQSQHRGLFTKKKKKLCWMAMRKSDRVTFCMHYCRYSHVKMNENCGLYPLHCLTGRPEWRDAQLVRNASFKGWAVWGSFYVLSIVCHAHIACSKNIASPTASRHSFLIIALLLLRLLRGSYEGKVSLSVCTLYVGGQAWQLITGHVHEKNL